MGKNYAILRVAKMNSYKKMRDAHSHNDRIIHIENVDPSRSHQNVNYIENNGKSYEGMLQDELSRLKIEGVKERTIRKDAVLGFEVYLGFSSEANGTFNIDEWAKANLEWLDKTFNPPNHEVHFMSTQTGKEEVAQVQNIKHMVLHMDESCPHIHAFVVPIDDKGNLNSHYYNKGRDAGIERQTDYAEHMAPFNLERGERFSNASHQQIQDYYQHIKKAVTSELPPPEKGEKIEDYQKRVNEVYQIALSNHRNEIVKKDQEIIRIQSEAKQMVYQAEKVSREARDIQEIFNQALDGDELADREMVREVLTSHRDLRTFKKAIEEHPNKDRAEMAYELFEEMRSWQLIHDMEFELEDERDY